MKYKHYSTILGFIMGGMLVWGIMTFVLPTTPISQSATEKQQNTDVMDAHFIEQMIPHHEDAITIATIAQTKATRSEIKNLADAIIKAQSTEISTMKTWYTQWFGRELPSGEAVMNQHGMMGNTNRLHMGIHGDATDINALEQAADFDKAFLEHMIPHHQMAVMMASMLKGGTKRPEMKTLADDIILAQTNEINQMRNWLQEWR